MRQYGEERAELAKLSTYSGVKAWKEYKSDTKHSTDFFKELKEKYMGIVAEIDKKYTVFTSRMQSMKGAMSTNTKLLSSPGSVVAVTADTSLRPNTTTISCPSIYYPGINTKMTEEVIMSDEPYNAQVKSSQLSPFMTKYRDKYVTGHDVVVPFKFPDDIHMKSKTAQEYRYRKKTAQHTVRGSIETDRKRHHFVTHGRRTASLEYPTMIFNENHIKPMPCVCGPCVLEFLRKREVSLRQLNKISENIPQNVPQKKFVVKKSLEVPETEKHSEEARIRPEKKLAEPTIFNDLYADTIRSRMAEDLEKRAEFKHDIGILAKTSRTSVTKRGTRRNVTRRIFRSETPSLHPKEERDVLITAEKIVAMRARGGTSWSRKVRLSNAIKKLSIKYKNKEFPREEKDHKRFDDFLQRMHQTNEDTKRKLIIVNYKAGLTHA